MSGGTAYILKGYGSIDPQWMRECFHLFRENAVNIRKLVLLKNGHPDRFFQLEIQFVPPADATQTAEFIQALTARLSTQQWQEQTLAPLG